MSCTDFWLRSPSPKSSSIQGGVSTQWPSTTSTTLMTTTTTAMAWRRRKYDSSRLPFIACQTRFLGSRKHFGILRQPRSFFKVVSAVCRAKTSSLTLAPACPHTQTHTPQTRPCTLLRVRCVCTHTHSHTYERAHSNTPDPNLRLPVRSDGCVAHFQWYASTGVVAFCEVLFRSNTTVQQHFCCCLLLLCRNRKGKFHWKSNEHPLFNETFFSLED